jgi:hypothetical protein
MSARGVRLGELGVLALIAALGTIQLPLPLGGDQAQFVTYARGLDSGAVLYRDLWDSKQPGIFFFYLVAGRLFGRDEIGAHTLELLQLLAFSLVLMRTGRSFLRSRLARAALPLLVVGLYYVAAQPKLMAQVEGLCWLPIYLVLWLSLGAEDGAAPSTTRAFAAGVCGGIVAWLKLHFLPIVAAIWVLALIRRGPRFVLPALAGSALPVLGLVLWGAAHGVLGQMAWTFLVYPPSMAKALEWDPAKFRDTLIWFGASFGAPLLLSVWGVRSARSSNRHGGMLTGAALWLVLGTVLVALEISWYRYYTLIVVVPLGLLAAFGLDQLSQVAAPRQTRLVALAFALVLLPALVPFSSRLHRLWQHGLAWSTEDRLAFQSEAHEAFAESRPEAEFLRRSVGQDETVHVFGDPLILFLAGRNQAIPISGWAPQAWSPQVWRLVLDQLRAARPTYVYTNQFARALIHRRSPEMAVFLLTDYRPARTGGSGVWLRRVDAAQRNGR